MEVFRDPDGKWQVKRDSEKNSRIDANTYMTFDGPVSIHPDRFKTTYDSECTNLTGTFANCAGGRTPWDTYLTAEENIHYYFWTDRKGPNHRPILEGKSESHPTNYRRYRIPFMGNAWGRDYARFNVDKERNEPNRFGWIVEIDPFDPDSTPVKHTALGRFFHEGAETVLGKDGHAVVFSGDDARNEYIYRFVGSEQYVEGDKDHNMRLLSHGTLSVAKFKPDGTGEWIPLEYGSGKLIEACAEGAFANQADVVIDARLAADVAGGTKMDRPGDVQPNEKTGRVYVMLTNNSERDADAVDAANPRANNLFGHIIEMMPEERNFAADKFAWDILVRCGDPKKIEFGAYWNAATSENSWFVCPDNAAVDAQGRLWIATDQRREWQDKTMRANGLFALETEGVRRGTPRMFFRVPMAAELCGPSFTPDGETLFLAVQHPGADGVDGYCGFEGPSTFKKPATRWPDFDPNMTPRPSVMVITKKGGGKIG